MSTGFPSLSTTIAFPDDINLSASSALALIIVPLKKRTPFTSPGSIILRERQSVTVSFSSKWSSSTVVLRSSKLTSGSVRCARGSSFIVSSRLKAFSANTRCLKIWTRAANRPSRLNSSLSTIRASSIKVFRSSIDLSENFSIKASLILIVSGSSLIGDDMSALASLIALLIFLPFCYFGILFAISTPRLTVFG